MILIIDGYNILKPIYAGQKISENQKSLFINQIRKYCQNNKNNRAIIVFDAGGNVYPEITHSGYVTVVHSGSLYSADEYIKDYIQKNKNKAEFLLVSSDRDIKNFARNFSIESIASYEFYKFLENKSESNTLSFNNIKKINREDSESNPELDKLMQQYSNISTYKEENNLENRAGNPQKLSKKERKTVKIIKKL